MKRYTKVILVLLLAITAFHLSGVETGFCDDSAAQATESHGCMACQPSHHSAAIPEIATTSIELPITFISPEVLTIKLQEPNRFILRPPISS
jgi:hypothetical protein